MKKRKGRKNGGIVIHQSSLVRALIVLLVVLAGLIVVYFFIQGPLKEISDLGGELGTYGPLGFDEGTMPSPLDCSDTELRAILDFVFQESSADTVILKNASYVGGGCIEYYMYKVVGEEIWTLSSKSYDGGSYYHKWIISLYADTSSEIVNNLTSTTFDSFPEFLGFLDDSEDSFFGFVKDRDVLNNDSAKIEFETKFKASNLGVESEIWSFQSGDLFLFEFSNVTVGIFDEFKSGRIPQNETLDVFYYEVEDWRSLTYPSPVPDISVYNDDPLTNILDLDTYFICPYTIDYTIFGDPEDKLGLSINSSTHIIDLDPKLNRYGTYSFNLSAECDNEVFNVTNLGSEMVFTIAMIDSDRPAPVSNNAPEFDFDDCEEISWVENTNNTIDMDYCWDDEDDDSLTYEYGDLHDYEDNISVTRLSGNRLKFIPDVGFNGSTYLRFYANDSTVRVSQRVDIVILTASVNTSRGDEDDDGSEDPDDSVLEIKSSSPPGSKISFSINENKNFVIIAENYENIEWYVDGELKKEGVLSYNFEETTPGDYLIKVKIINGTNIESKTWEITIEERAAFERDVFGFDFDVGQVVFYLIVSVLVIIILLVIWLFIVEKNKRNKKVDLGFGVSVVPSRRGKNSSSNQFNIPRE